MSGIGHFAAGFAARPVTPKAPLLVLLAAAEINDLLYFFFSGVGLEQKVVTTMDFTQGVKYLTTGTNPWSHGLFLSVLWASLAAALALAYYKDRRTAVTLGLVVFSHWLLDFIMHSNLPLFFGGSLLLGLGLENTGLGFLSMTILDLLLLTAGMAYYFLSRRKPKPQG